METERVIVADVIFDGEQPGLSAGCARGGVPFDSERADAELPGRHVSSAGPSKTSMELEVF